VSRVEGRAGAREAVGGALVRLVRRDVAVGVVGYGGVVEEERGGAEGGVLRVGLACWVFR
jgi:hypothetical protein